MRKHFRWIVSIAAAGTLLAVGEIPPTNPSDKGNSEAQVWISAVQALDGGEWSQSDVNAVRTLVKAVESSPELPVPAPIFRRSSWDRA